jgi:serine phosphatase RsbU (regulator of sigma subunit)
MVIRKAFLVLLLIQGTELPAQLSRRADSLVYALSVAREDSVRMRLNIQIADELIFSNPDTAEFYIKCGLTYAKSVTNRRLAAKAYNLLGISESFGGKKRSALKYFLQSYQFFEETGDKAGYSDCINNMGTIYSEMGRDSLAIKHFKEACSLKMQLGDAKNSAVGLFNIASCFTSLNETDSALNYLAKLAELQEEASVVFIDPTPLLAEIFLKKGNYFDALTFYTRFYRTSASSRDAHVRQNTLLGMSRANIGLKNFTEAKLILDEVLHESIREGFHENRLAVYELLSIVYSAKGQYPEAFSHQKKFLSLKDSLESISEASEMFELSARYESAKHEKELIGKDLIISEQEAQRKAFAYSAGIGFAALLSITILVVAFLLKNRHQNRLLNARNNEIILQRQKIISSLNYARKIQSSILAPEEQIRRHFPDSFIYFKPKDIVSGDFYWFAELGDMLMISTIDCTGHGVPGAFMSLIANAKLNMVVREKRILDPGTILNEVHKEIVQALNQQKGNTGSQDGMDMSLCLIGRNERKIWYAGAQNSIILVHGDALEEIKADNMSIGGSAFEACRIKNDQLFTTREMSYEAGTFLFMYTDGYLDQFGGEAARKFNKGRFRKLILEITSKGISQAKEHIEEQFEAWKRHQPQVDDILIIGARL